MMIFRRTFRLALLLAAGFALGSCGSDSSDNVSFRVIQASPDLPPVNFLVDGVILRGAVDYKGGTGFLTVTPQPYDFSAEVIVPSLDGPLVSLPVTPAVPIAMVTGHEYTFIAIGKQATDSVQSLIVDNLTETVPQGSARLQFFNAAQDVPTVDFYVTAIPALPDVLPDVSTQTPMAAQVVYGEQPAARQLLPTGKYVIRVTLAGSTDVIYDSGELNLANGNDFLVLSVENTAAGPAPISLAVSSGFRTFYSPAGTFDLLDKDSTSDFRVVQVSPDSPALNVVGDPGTEGGINRTFASGLTYLSSTGYVPTVPDFYTVFGVKTSDPTAAPPVFTVTGNLLVGQRTILYTTGLLATMNPLVVPSDVRSVHAYGKLRILDASPASVAVDVYVQATVPGTDITTVSPNLSGLVLRSATPYLPVFPRVYTVTFTTAGTKTVLASEVVIATEGTVQSAILVDAVRVDSTSTGLPPAVLVTDDLPP